MSIKKRIPKKITPCPIIEGVLEIRYEKNKSLSPNMFPGQLAAKLGITESNDLPESDIPERIASEHPQLKFVPRVQLFKENIIVQLGPNVISINNPDDYIGWDDFEKHIEEVIDSLLEINAIDHIMSISLRYIDFFDHNIFENIDLKVSMSNKDFSDHDLFIQYMKENSDYRAVVKIRNDVKMKVKGSEDKGADSIEGSTIDIDTQYLQNIPTEKEALMQVINSAHTFEKETFYDLVSESFIETLNPEYE